MKKTLLSLCIALVAFACKPTTESLTIEVANPTSLDRTTEVVELEMDVVVKALQLEEGATIVVTDSNDEEVVSQITYDNLLLIPITLTANEVKQFTIKEGTPATYPSKVFGAQFPERVDDIAWENDRIAFRTYGPALQASKERAFGYDVWLKSVDTLVVADRYAKELNKETRAKINELRKTDPKAASALYKSVSYHVDHGNGHDCYKVGPTLGGGTAALMVGDEIIYPYCYDTFDIVDNGPLRFTVQLTFTPMVVGDDNNVVESRIISIDAGSQMNKTIVSYASLSQPAAIAAGIVLHEEQGIATVAYSQEKGYIAYADPSDNLKNDNGTIYVAAVVPQPTTSVAPSYFDEQERTKERGGANGHLLAISEYTPNSDYTYYWGAGWSKYGFADMRAWVNYVEQYATQVANPLVVITK